MAESYVYDVSQFTGLVAPYTVPAPDRLTNEVEESITAVALVDITVNPADQPNKTIFTFESALSPTDEGLLGDVVTSHTGEPLPEPGPSPMSHGSLTGVTENQHHPRLHASTHGSGQTDALTLAPAQVGADQAAFNANKLQGRGVKDEAPSADDVLTWDQTDGWVPKPAQGGGGYPESYYAESEGNSSTTCDDPQTKVQIVQTFDGGTYLLRWYGEVWASCIGSHTRFQVWVDGSAVAWTDIVMAGSTNENPSGGVKRLALDADEHAIKLTFCRVEECTAYIRRARLFIEKVGD